MALQQLREHRAVPRVVFRTRQPGTPATKAGLPRQLSHGGRAQPWPRAEPSGWRPIVTTHSDVLVDALTDVPESIVVCEKPDGQAQLRRLDPNDLEAWLKDYRLGQLWISGEIGGNRW